MSAVLLFYSGEPRWCGSIRREYRVVLDDCAKHPREESAQDIGASLNLLEVPLHSGPKARPWVSREWEGQKERKRSTNSIYSSKEGSNDIARDGCIVVWCMVEVPLSYFGSPFLRCVSASLRSLSLSLSLSLSTSSLVILPSQSLPSPRSYSVLYCRTLYHARRNDTRPLWIDPSTCHYTIESHMAHYPIRLRIIRLSSCAIANVFYENISQSGFSLTKSKHLSSCRGLK